MIQLRNPTEIAAIGRSGEIVSQALQAAVDLVEPGVTTGELDAAVTTVLSAAGADAIFLGAIGETPFPTASCVSVNHQALHGIPGDRVLVNGDLVTIDTGCRFEGWCADAARSVGVGALEPAASELLTSGQRALETALAGLDSGGRWSDVVQRVRAEVTGMRVRLIEGPTGHGIGRELHEDPVAGWEWPPRADFEVVDGLVLAVEPVVTTGNGRLGIAADRWTLETCDNHPTVHFEQTVAMTAAGVEVLTRW